MIGNRLIDKYTIINTHPSLLPKFGGKGMYGMNVHRAVIEAKEILGSNMDKLTAVATKLLEKEKIDGEEFEEIFNS